MLEHELIEHRIAQNNRYLLKELKSRAQIQYRSWKITIPFCSKTLVKAWLQTQDRVTKHAQKCELNFDDDGYFFDSGWSKIKMVWVNGF